MSRFVAVDRDTAYLLPPSVDEWLPQDHLARFVVEVIDQLDLSELTRQYAGRGSDAYHPAMMLGLLVYGYATGVHSSRKIERACHDSVVVDPAGKVVAGPLRREAGILYAEIDIARVAPSRRTLDVTGHYARPDIFELQVRRAPVTPVRFVDG